LLCILLSAATIHPLTLIVTAGHVEMHPAGVYSLL
jgi:hypothetical protein